MRLRRSVTALVAVLAGVLATLTVPSPALASGSVESTPGDIKVYLEVDGTGLRVNYVRIRAARHTKSPYEYEFRYWTQESSNWTPRKTAPKLEWYDICTGYACSTSPDSGWVFVNRTLSRNQYLCVTIWTLQDGYFDNHRTADYPICLWIHS